MIKDKFYLVEEILSFDGTPKQDGRADKTVGRKVCISSHDGVYIGFPCYLWYFTDWEGNSVHHFCHKTSDVQHYEQDGDLLTIDTQHSIYKLREVQE